MSRRPGGWRGSRIPLRVFRSRLARQCQHATSKLVPASNDELAVICSGCGLLLDTLDRTETLDD